jgi:hypothetical protein
MCSLDIWSLLQKLMQYEFIFYCDFVQMLKFCELNQISFLDEMAVGAQTM